MRRGRRLALRAGLALLVCAAACQAREPGRGAGGSAGSAATVASAGAAEVAVIALERIEGLSGLTADGRGGVWTVPERRHALVELPGEGAPRVWPVRDVPEGLDMESIAWLGAEGGRDRFAVGTEGACAGDTHAVLVLERQGEVFRVVERIPLSMASWSMECDDGHGIEGLCRAGDASGGDAHLIAAVEHPGRDRGRRYAALGQLALGTRQWTYHRLALTSETGKISALDCRRSGDGIEVWAVERHFETSRVVRFVLPLEAPAGDRAELVTPAVVLDLAAHTDGGRRNFEGLVRAPGRVRLVVDNAWVTITGPNEIVSVPLP